MLYLMGLGLGDEKDLTLREIEIARTCECFAELYTNKWEGSLSELEKIIGKKINLLKRNEIETKVFEIVSLAEKKDVAIFFPGDPLAATTHTEFLIEARRKKIPVRVLHNSSIFSAVAECGLQLYKFGKTATIPFSGKLENVKNVLKENKKIGAHTLLLLDLDSEMGIYMNTADAIKILLKEKVLKLADKIIAAGNLGTENFEIVFASAKVLKDKKILTPAVLVIPGKLHFRERDFLENIKV